MQEQEGRDDLAPRQEIRGDALTRGAEPRPEPELESSAERARTPGCATVLYAFGSGLIFALLATGIATYLTDSTTASLFFLELGLLAGVVAYLVASGFRVSTVLRFGRVPHAVYPLALLLGVALLIANIAATTLLGPSLRDIELVTGAMSTAERLMLVLTVALAAPIIEESLFRGLLQGVLESRLRPWLAIAAAALPFALLHGPEPAIFFFFWSLPLGWVTWRTGSIRPCIVVHAVNNLVGLIGLFATGPIDPDTLESGPGMVMTAMLVLPAAALWAAWLCVRIVRLAGGGSAPGIETTGRSLS